MNLVLSRGILKSNFKVVKSLFKFCNIIWMSAYQGFCFFFFFYFFFFVDIFHKSIILILTVLPSW